LRRRKRRKRRKRQQINNKEPEIKTRKNFNKMELNLP